MPRKSVGTVERHGSGWRAVYWRNGRRVRSPILESRAAAEVALQHVRAAVAADPTIGQKPTLRSWGVTWLQRRNTRGLRSDRNRWARHVHPSPIAALPLVDLDRKTLRRWIESVSRHKVLEQVEGGGRASGEQALSAQTVRHVFNLVRRALADAVEEGLIPANPAAGMRIKVSEHQRTREWTYLTEDEIDQVLTYLQDPSQRALYSTAIYAGLREGELIGLRWQDVELGARPHIMVRRSHAGPTKNEKKRMVPLLGPAAEALREWRERSRAEADSYVWPAPRGGRRSIGDDFGWATKRRGDQQPELGVRELAGITRRIVFHDLRHTCASHLVMGSWGRAWRLDEVRDLLGHSSIAMTQRYAHLSPEYLHAAAAATVVPPRNAPASRLFLSNLPTVGSVGLEPTANGLKGSSISLDSQGDIANWGDTWGAIEANAALTVLQRAAAGQDLPAAALAVLEIEPSDPMAARRAVERARELMKRSELARRQPRQRQG